MAVKAGLARLMEETRGLSSDEFLRPLEDDHPAQASDLVSIQDLAAVWGVSVRTSAAGTSARMRQSGSGGDGA